VIGVAAFREKRPPPIAYAPPPPPTPYYPAPYAQGGYEDRERSDNAAAAAKSAPSRAASDAAASSGALARSEAAPMGQPQQLGTGHGERRYDPVTQTEFERASWRPNQRIALYYDSYEALVSRGIIRTRYYDYARGPQPFPNGFTPDPN